MPRMHEPTVENLLKEREVNQNMIKWQKRLIGDLLDYIDFNADYEHLIETLLHWNYTPRELVYDMNMNEEDVAPIARLLGYGIEQDI